MNEELLDLLPGFEFFQAVRLLELIRRDRRPVGFDSDPRDETVRFSSRAAFGFSGRDINTVVPGAQDETGAHSPTRIEVNFLGIATPQSFGSLPHVYVEEIQRLTREKNHALKAFLDCFNHRLVSLFYRSWKKHHFAVSYERDRRSVLEHALFAVVGLGTSALRGRLSFDDRAILARSGHLARGRSNATGLADMLRDYFEVDAEVAEFVPAWYTIEAGDQYRLGSRSARLGQEVVIGSRMQTGQFNFRVSLGPLTWAAYQAFLPGGKNHDRLLDLVRLAAGPDLDFEVQLLLQAAEVPRVEFRRGADPSTRTRLGWSTWLRAKKEETQRRGEGVFRARDLQPSA